MANRKMAGGYQSREDVLRDPAFKQWAKTLDKKTRGYFPQMTMEDLVDSWHRSTGQKPAFEHPESHLFADRDGQQWKVVHKGTGQELRPGQTIYDFRGEPHVYHGIDSFPGRGGDNPASSGRISTHAPEYRPGPHWFNSPRTFYPDVFNAEIVPHTDWNPDAEQDPFDPRLIGAARKSHRELLAEIDKLADWTKYDDDVDPAVEAYGKNKVPSTTVSQPPKDWARRKPAGDPGKRGGTWTPPTIPRKKK